MSFVRPEVARAARRWAETAVAGALAALAAWGALGVVTGGGVGAWFCLAALAPLVLWARIAALRALLAERSHAGEGPGGPGIAALREGEIGYLGPETGGMLPLEAIDRVEAVPTADGPVWRLTTAEGGVLDIPARAEGAEAVPAGLEALPGFSDARALEALGAARHALVWERRPTARLGAPVSPP